MLKRGFKNCNFLDFEENSCDVTNHPFPTLKKVLQEVPIHTGFNIEVKWPTLDEVVTLFSYC